MALHFSKIESPYIVMLCVKFGWISLPTDGQRDEKKDKCWTQKNRKAHLSCELKMKIVLMAQKLYLEQIDNGILL